MVLYFYLFTTIFPNYISIGFFSTWEFYGQWIWYFWIRKYLCFLSSKRHNFFYLPKKQLFTDPSHYCGDQAGLLLVISYPAPGGQNGTKHPKYTFTFPHFPLTKGTVQSLSSLSRQAKKTYLLYSPAILLPWNISLNSRPKCFFFNWIALVVCRVCFNYYFNFMLAERHCNIVPFQGNFCFWGQLKNSVFGFLPPRTYEVYISIPKLFFKFYFTAWRIHEKFHESDISPRGALLKSRE